ncbi:YtxH domain-containing protein [Aureibaculum algae]|uniref:YtxH domain-containing protein n=1 Tax=Aureibaculum algae TaxID=2584122 RepID=A0A5B7TPP6_9FLAO|nr:YtxH domain-containing protein [Aureibaculum algae]QCX38735.1 YtxH domain-containing protein [Aureibaculum algae]
MAKANHTGNVLVALAAGAALGAGMGILFAPDKGKNTRGKIKHKLEDTGHDISERMRHAKDELTKTAEVKKAEFDKKLDDTLSNMSYKAEDIISSLEKKLEDLKTKNAQFQKN